MRYERIGQFAANLGRQASYKWLSHQQPAVKFHISCYVSGPELESAVSHRCRLWERWKCSSPYIVLTVSNECVYVCSVILWKFFGKDLVYLIYESCSRFTLHLFLPFIYLWIGLASIEHYTSVYDNSYLGLFMQLLVQLDLYFSRTGSSCNTAKLTKHLNGIYTLENVLDGSERSALLSLPHTLVLCHLVLTNTNTLPLRSLNTANCRSRTLGCSLSKSVWHWKSLSSNVTTPCATCKHDIGYSIQPTMVRLLGYICQYLVVTQLYDWRTSVHRS